MKILITPSEIIELCLFSNYQRFVLKTRDDAKIRQIIKENQLISLNENDAYIIGLTKFIKTENLVHRCKLEIDDMLKIKSTILKINEVDKVLINKATLLKDVLEFKYRFPDCYEPDDVYKKSISELISYANELLENINSLKEYPMVIKEKNYVFVLSSDVAKYIKV